MQLKMKLAALAAALAAAAPALADATNGPDPYAAGFGFDTPQEAAWGSWTRGAGGSIYAEWDTFVDASYAGTRTAAPDVGSYNASNANLSWSAGTFAAGSGNLYSFSAVEAFTVSLDNSTLTGPVRVVLQTESWGMEIDPDSVTLNGVAASFSDITYTNPNFESSFGTVTLSQRLFYWDVAAAPTTYSLYFDTGSEHSMSLAQVSVDIASVAAVPEPSTWALMLAGLGAAGVMVRRRVAG